MYKKLKRQPMELKTTNDTLNKAKEELEKENDSKTKALLKAEKELEEEQNTMKADQESHRIALEEIMFKNKESSEKVEQSTQTDESTDPKQNMNEDVLSKSEADENDIASKIDFKAKFKEIDCKYINGSKGCKRGKQCWYSHGKKTP